MKRWLYVQIVLQLASDDRVTCVKLRGKVMQVTV